MPCCQDNELMLRAWLAGLNTAFCPLIGAIYRSWSSATVSRKDPSLLASLKFQLVQQMFRALTDCGAIRSGHKATATRMLLDQALELRNHCGLESALAFWGSVRRDSNSILDPAFLGRRSYLLLRILGAQALSFL